MIPDPRLKGAETENAVRKDILIPAPNRPETKNPVPERTFSSRIVGRVLGCAIPPRFAVAHAFRAREWK